MTKIIAGQTWIPSPSKVGIMRMTNFVEEELVQMFVRQGRERLETTQWVSNSPVVEVETEGMVSRTILLQFAKHSSQNRFMVLAIA